MGAVDRARASLQATAKPGTQTTSGHEAITKSIGSCASPSRYAGQGCHNNQAPLLTFLHQHRRQGAVLLCLDKLTSWHGGLELLFVPRETCN